MKIIGHRGAASLGLENSLESIRLAKKAGVDAIEFDVRMTADGHFVMGHDADFKRLGDDERPISELSLDQAKTIVLHNGETVASLEDALAAGDGTQLFVEAKGDHWAPNLAAELQRLKPHNVTVIAINGEELARFHQLLPEMPVYLVQRFNPIDTFHAIRFARASGFNGVDFNFWLLNPFTYWLTRYYGLDIAVYTVNHRWIAHFLSFLFPGIGVTTDRPQEMQLFRRWRKNRS